MTYQTVMVARKVRIDRELINGTPRHHLPEYKIWQGMKVRCFNPNSRAFPRYGGRGITVCERWREDFANFYADMGARPSDRHSIDRIDNDGNYEPGNCRWATPDVQANNKSTGARPYSRSDSWTDDEVAILRRMFAQFYTFEEMATVIHRTPATIRLRAHYLKLRRDGSFTRLCRKHPSLAPVLREKGPEAFMAALKDHIEGETAKKRHQKAQKAASEAKVIAEIMDRQIDRNEKMRALRLAGLTLARCADIFGITRERARQLQLRDFKSGGERKVSQTRPENRNRHVDRLVRAWNMASVEARQVFLDLATHDIRADLPRLLKTKRARPSAGEVSTAHKFSAED